MTPLDIPVGTKYRFTEQFRKEHPWVAQGVYTKSQEMMSTYQRVVGEPEDVDRFVYFGHGHETCPIEIVE
ncbi:hypothetical protein PQC38_gp023 [Aeromonas phage BUCT695]|uniref:hypothetical protein n=1 Tax=Aeromonas phage BUCT695 TaxID=2908630 RepID=UPI0023295E31|nr:hypothetical protein PQC38_gp023 [Aeromonas phage BUCT695]UIW10499.1 hypothetical protein [Aeromonas phage BUCT695]